MTSASSTPRNWDDRYDRILRTRRARLDDTEWVAIDEIVVGDQLLLFAEPFIVTRCTFDGPVAHIEATRGTRTIHNDYLRIERVEVVCPRPLAATDRKAPA